MEWSHFSHQPELIVSGNPVRESIVQSNITRAEGIAFFGLNPEKKTVLSIGGSLGAKSINEAIGAGLDAFDANGLQLIWQTGKPYAAAAKEIVGDRENVWTNEFIIKMDYAFAAADIVISRAGAMAIAELCVVKKTSVVCALPICGRRPSNCKCPTLGAKVCGYAY